MILKIKNIIICIIVLGLASIAFAVAGIETFDPSYVGAKNCKMCHFIQFKSWLETSHATAFDLLKDDEKQNPKCIKCHTTGTVDNPGVQCEACHGPGSNYKRAFIMKDPVQSKEAGLIAKPGEEICKKCHNSESPTFKEFNFGEEVKNPKSVHTHAQKE